MRRAALLAGCLGVILSAPAAGQWRVGVEAGADHAGYWIRSRQDGGPLGRPTTTWPVVLRLERGGDRLRAAVSGSRTRPGLELSGDGLLVAVRPAFQLVTVTPEISSRLARLDGAGQLRASLALPFERWSFPGYTDPPRWRVGMDLGVAVELPVGRVVAARVAVAAGTVFGHPLKETDILEDYELRRFWRRSLRVGMLARP